MFKDMEYHDTLRTAAAGLAGHPQDHGWRELYRLFAYGLEGSAAHLDKLLIETHAARSTSATHLLTLLGIALKVQTPAVFENLVAADDYPSRLRLLERTLESHQTEISNILLTRQNSFSCARRYLVTPVLLTAYFGPSPDANINFADLGSGIGDTAPTAKLRRPVQVLCSRPSMARRHPRISALRLSSIFAVDRGPMPDLSWVRACYGQSEYYSRLYFELLETLSHPDVQTSPATFRELDLLDFKHLADFINENEINVANMSYVLYELDPGARRRVIETIVHELHPPGVLLVTEPANELHRQGCVVDLFDNRSLEPMSLCYVSDGHFIGYVLPLDDYDAFTHTRPVSYES